MMQCQSDTQLDSLNDEILENFLLLWCEDLAFASPQPCPFFPFISDHVTESSPGDLEIFRTCTDRLILSSFPSSYGIMDFLGFLFVHSFFYFLRENFLLLLYRLIISTIIFFLTPIIILPTSLPCPSLILYSPASCEILMELYTLSIRCRLVIFVIL